PARSSGAAVVYVSNFTSEGGDLASIDLPGTQNQLISAVLAAQPRTVVVLQTGSAVAMPWVDRAGGILEAWFNGQEDGNALADVLFGDANPSGKLPVSFPRSLADVPAHTPAQWPGANNRVEYSEGLKVGYRWYDATGIAPLFPFGHGLSYTSFGFTALNVGRQDANGSVKVTAQITNTGKRRGADVVQLYLGNPAAGEPPKQLKGFARVDLMPGQGQQVTFTLGRRDLSFWNTATHTWVVPTGTFKVMVGDFSRSLPLAGSLTL